MAAEQNQLGIADYDVGFLQLGAPCTDSLDLPAFEGDTCLETLFDKIIVERLFVLYDAHRVIK